MLVLAIILAVSALYFILIGINEAIQTALLGRFDSATIVVIIIGVVLGAIAVLLALWNEKRARKKRTKEEIERDAMLESNGACICARCGLNLRLIPLEDIKKDVISIDGKLYCGVCAANLLSERKTERKIKNEGEN